MLPYVTFLWIKKESYYQPDFVPTIFRELLYLHNIYLYKKCPMSILKKKNSLLNLLAKV